MPHDAPSRELFPGRPNGDGYVAAKKVDRLIGKKGTRQLRGERNSVLVLSFWHQWGIFRRDCEAHRHVKGALQTGLLYAATLGRAGDPVFGGEEFPGRPWPIEVQRCDGLLIGPNAPNAVVWLFQRSMPVIFENTRAPLQGEARSTLLRAFGVSRKDSVSRLAA